MITTAQMARIFQSSIENSVKLRSCFLPKLKAESAIERLWNGGGLCQPRRLMSSLHLKSRWRRQVAASPTPIRPPALSRHVAADLDDPGIFMTPGGRREPAEEMWSRQGDRLVIIDGKAMVYRAYHGAYTAFRREAAPMDGTSGPLNELDTILTVVKALNFVATLLELRPTHMLVSFDAAGKNFRHDLLPSYKANRAPTPDAVCQSLALVKRIFMSMGVQVLEVAGVEADDVIGTVTVRAESAGMEVRIASPDKDFFQLLSDNVRCLRPMQRGGGTVIFGPNEFRAKYNGIEPSQFVDALSLMGDTVDNVPGIHGIGEKFATKLIKEHGSLEVLLANAASIKRQLHREGLMNDSEKALLAKKLVMLRTSLPSFMVPLKLSDLRLAAPSDGGKSFQAALDALDMHVNTTAVPRLKDRMQDIWTAFEQ